MTFEDNPPAPQIAEIFAYVCTGEYTSQASGSHSAFLTVDAEEKGEGKTDVEVLDV